MPSSHPDDRSRFDEHIEIDDTFDYSRIEKPLLIDNECSNLESSLRLPIGKMTKKKFNFLLVEEIRQRILNSYDNASISFSHWSCDQTHSKLNECAPNKGAFILSIEKENCGAILTDYFQRCVLIFCLE